MSTKTYTCAMCAKTATDPTGWARIQITHTHYDSPQGTVTSDDELAVVDCCSDACRDAWKEKTR